MGKITSQEFKTMGTGSLIDADLLDGQHGSYYAPTASPTLTGTVTLPNTTFIKGTAADSTNNSYLRFAKSDGTTRTGWVGDSDSTDDIVLGSDVGNVQLAVPTGKDVYARINSTSYKIFHAGNDGAGSGLDADTVDGYDVATTATANTIALRDASGYLKSVFLNCSRADEATTAASYIYDSGDGWLRKKTLANTKAEIVTSAAIVAGLGYTPVSKSESYGSNAIYRYRDLVGFDSASTTGTMKITLPTTWTSTMLGIKIIGYDYSGNGTWELNLGGYNYVTTPSWVNTSAILVGTAPFTQVRFGHDGTKCCILLGTTSTVWSYPKVVIEEVLSTFGNQTSYASGWAISIITSETGITNLVSVSTPGYSLTSHTHNYLPLGAGTYTVTGTVDFSGSLTTAGEGLWRNGMMPKSLSGNGYLKLQNGLIIQWGMATIVNNTTITFPLAFPTSIYSVVTTPNSYGTWTATTGSLTLANFVCATGAGATGVNVFWIAIGS